MTEPVQLNAVGGTQFNWSTISGEPINIGINFSCNNCPNPIVNPFITTMYKVQTNLFAGCGFFDTITVIVGPNFEYNLSLSDSISCVNSDIFLSIDSIPNDTYLYHWNPSINLNSNFIQNPIFNSSIPGLFKINVSIDNQQGCKKDSSFDLTLLPSDQPNISISSDPALLTPGDTAQLKTNHQSLNESCGLSNSNYCYSVVADSAIGIVNDTNSRLSYPAHLGTII